MASVSTFPAGFEIVQLAGPIIIAHLADWALFATLTVQLYLYYQAFPNDRLFSKCLVYGVYSIQLVQIILSTADAFKMFGSHYGDVSALTQVDFAWFTVPFTIALDSIIVQSFYAFRIFILSKSRIIPAFIVLASTAVCVDGFIDAISTFKAGNLTTLHGREISTTFAVCTRVSETIPSLNTFLVLIPFDLLNPVLTGLQLTKTNTGFRRTNALVSKLIRLTIETGSLTAVVALTTLILFFAFPGQVYYTTLANIMPSMYANTMFAVLNSRFKIVGGRSTETSSIDLISFPTHLQNIGTMPGTATQRGPVVSIDREIFFNRDMALDSPVEMKAVRPAFLCTIRCAEN
ncbi:hypothetical protein MSAN_01992700 [Mycena sanguinolenta]|uniref:DUF6534 domain-containing protein n=1 Tax=Mycena sanguinolenta TaxID=230812 RepID=A0A8H7CM48_9AGAR|nr:hypothetical protein MSAN_01992700 [Mycena sanguinolenta]